MTVLLGAALCACGPVEDPTTQEVPTDDDDDDGNEGLTTTGLSAPTDGGEDEDATEDETEDETEGDETGCTFLCNDLDMIEYECNMFAQDCPEGEKCMPWVNDGGNSWNATRCAPVDESPGQPGDESSVEGNAGTGLDDCEIGAMCWDVDPETNTGYCVPMCTGDAANPVCEDPDATCVNVNNGAIVLCLPQCDPLLQDCGEGQACYEVPGEDFACAPDFSGEMGGYADPCGAINACDPGLGCVNAALVPDCQGSPLCCTEFCDLDDPVGDAQCSGQAGGQECLALSSDPQPGYEAVGECALPN